MNADLSFSEFHMNGQPAEALRLAVIIAPPTLLGGIIQILFGRIMSVPTPANNSLLFRFGPFKLDLQACELRKGDILLHLPPQPCKVLALLASHPNKVFTRQEMKDEIWGADTFVDFDQGLNAAIRQIRAALCDDAETPRYIETLPRRGYRFIGEIHGYPAAAEGAAAEGPRESSPLSGPAILRPVSYRRRWPTLLTSVGLALLLLVAGVYLGRKSIWSHAKPRTGRIMFAVLPFENLSGDPEQEYFSEGLTEEMISRLGQLEPQRLGVIARTSALQYKGTKKRIDEIAKELGVDYILEGTVRHAGDRVRVSAQLIQVSDQTHIWAKNYERDLRDILALQEEVAQAIASEVEISLTPGQQARLVSTTPVNAAAHEAYLRGLYELHGMTVEATETLKLQSIEKAIGYFQQALTHDPNYPLAYSGLADAYTDLSTDYRAPLEVRPKAKAAAAKAVELDDTLADAHASLGYVSLVFDWDWARAEFEFRRALELNPSLPRAHAGYAEYLLFKLGRSDEAIRELQRAYALDPLLPTSHGDVGWFYFLARRYAESIEAEKVRHADIVLALSYAELGQRDLAIAAADRAVSSTQIPANLSLIAAAYALAGRVDKARAMLPGIKAQARDRYVCGFSVACIYSVLGEKEQAFAWLERAYRDHSD
jgi:TolB-like protein/DNA-binding winged helix-turn-helix (wHTH) protein/Tfp pilus assembly protein PilF